MTRDIDRIDTLAPSSTYGPPSGDRPPLILIAEDDEDSMDIVTTMFQYAGYRVAQATTGLEALTMARELRPALLVLDVAMPAMNGWEVADHVRRDSDEGTRALPILVLTAHAFAEDRQRARALGCDGYLAKPADVRRVVREAKRILAGEPWGSAGEHDTHD